MADYFTYSCTQVDCPKGKEGVAITWVDEMKTFTEKIRDLKQIREEGGPEEEWDDSWLKESVHGAAFLNHNGGNLLSFIDSLDSFNVEISRETDANGRISVFFTDNDEDLSVDYTALLIQDLLRVLDSDKDVFMHWANTCSKHRSGSFSGGSCLICKDDVTFISVEDALKQLRHENRKCNASFTS